MAIFLSLALGIPAQAQSPAGDAEQRAARRFETLRKRPPQMLAFLRAMPKGADLHSHLSGAVYAESYIQWAADMGLCVNQATSAVVDPPCDAASGQIPAASALTDNALYAKLVDAWSMRNWRYSGKTGHEQFFDSFGKFGGATSGNTGRMLAEALSRAARGGVLYLELMLTPDGSLSSKLGRTAGWDGDFQGALEKLSVLGIGKSLEIGIKTIRDAEAEKNRILGCGTSAAAEGCNVEVRYIAQVSRGSDLGAVFAQMVSGFAIANEPGSKVVALNLVQPEDWFSSMKNFPAQMEMLRYLRPLYPRAKITLHAGELTPGIAPPEALSFHIRDSIMIGGASRIGHGVAVMSEDDPYGLLREMAKRGVMVEICLTSNDVILGISKERHPLLTYIEYGVPVALATDDEGVSRSDITQEFLKAAEDHALGYIQLKAMARTSLQHAFIEGESLWADAVKFTPAPQCRRDFAARKLQSQACEVFIGGSAKAALQWRLEERFRVFESGF
ncbi:MAG: adenosine deaminase family protein [Deltaproteobacteria bacterium]